MKATKKFNLETKTVGRRKITQISVAVIAAAGFLLPFLHRLVIFNLFLPT